MSKANARLAPILVTNLHRRHTGVSATILSLVPHQRNRIEVDLYDSGDLDLPGKIRFRDILRGGWARPAPGQKRVWHARRDNELALGLILRSVLRQPWTVIFTSAAPKRPGPIMRFLQRHADGIIATSQRTANFLARHDVIINHGVDTELYHPPADRAAEVAALGHPGKTLLATFGRLRPSKGTDLVIEALIEALPKHPDVIAAFTGLCKGSEKAWLEALQARIKAAGLTDRILFLGDLPRGEVLRWYRAATLCIAASRSEGFGLTPLEAMSSGAAVLTSDAGAWPDFVTPAIGARVPAGDGAALATALNRLLEDRDALARMGLAARKQAEERHSILVEAAAITDFCMEMSRRG